MNVLRRVVAVLLGAGCLSAFAAPVVLADAGTIAGATPVVYGQQEFGNTATGGVGQTRCSTGSSYRSWWALSVTSGDALTVDWETQITSMNMNLFPVGTTDFTFLNTEPLVSEQVNANYKEQATYTATQTGIVPLEFHSDSGCNNPPGDYNFTASVLHAVVLSLPTVSTLPLSGTISVGVHNPDGVPLGSGLSVTFNVLISGESYTAVGSAPVSNGVASVSYVVPATAAGHSVTIEATSSGAGYLPGTSATQIVSILAPLPPPPPLPPCVVPSFRASLSTVERRIRAAHCSLGTVYYSPSRHRHGVILRLSARPGTHLASGTILSVFVSSGPPRKHRRHRHR